MFNSFPKKWPHYMVLITGDCRKLVVKGLNATKLSEPCDNKATTTKLRTLRARHATSSRKDISRMPHEAYLKPKSAPTVPRTSWCTWYSRPVSGICTCYKEEDPSQQNVSPTQRWCRLRASHWHSPRSKICGREPRN